LDRCPVHAATNTVSKGPRPHEAHHRLPFNSASPKEAQRAIALAVRAAQPLAPHVTQRQRSRKSVTRTAVAEDHDGSRSSTRRTSRCHDLFLYILPLHSVVGDYTLLVLHETPIPRPHEAHHQLPINSASPKEAQRAIAWAVRAAQPLDPHVTQRHPQPEAPAPEEAWKLPSERTRPARSGTHTITTTSTPLAILRIERDVPPDGRAGIFYDRHPPRPPAVRPS